MKVVCIYHSRDLDGWVSGAIVKKWCEENNHEIELAGWDYGQDEPLSKITDDEGSPLCDVVFICDVTLSKETMENIYDADSGVNLIWCDHHKSALDDSKGMGFENCDGIRNTKLAGCELTWQYCYPDDDIPHGVELLGRYDTFRYKEDDDANDVINFQYASRAYMTDVDSIQKFIFGYEPDDENTITEWMDDGAIIMAYVKIDSQETYNKHRFDVELDGHKAVCIPRERFNPVNYDIDYHADGYDIAICFWYKGSDDIWEFSIYNDDDKVDCAAIAKKMGGGGHAGASGFTVKDINTIIKPK